MLFQVFIGIMRYHIIGNVKFLCLQMSHGYPQIFYTFDFDEFYFVQKIETVFKIFTIP